MKKINRLLGTRLIRKLKWPVSMDGLGEGMGGAQAQLRTRTRINPSPKRSYIST